VSLSPDISCIKTLVTQSFPLDAVQIERVMEGVSTFVYRIAYQKEVFYLRVLPEENASFAPEVAVHTQLRQMQVKVPEVIYFEHFHEALHRSVMITTEIKGHPLSQPSSLHENELDAIFVEAGRDLAQINSLAVNGFGWVKRDIKDTSHLHAEYSTYRNAVLEYWDADLAYLSRTILHPSEITALKQIFSHYETLLDGEQGYLAHGDFDTNHIYQESGKYTGIIDFGEIRGANRWYDLGHFHMRDGETLPNRGLSALTRGYEESISLPSNHEQSILFTSILINIGALAKSLRKHPANRYTQHQLQVLREDLVALQLLPHSLNDPTN
jgi:aminoglycoside phosphotransferase (APT) family kinase protein